MQEHETSGETQQQGRFQKTLDTMASRGHDLLVPPVDSAEITQIAPSRARCIAMFVFETIGKGGYNLIEPRDRSTTL